MNSAALIVLGPFYGLSLWVEKPSVGRLNVIPAPRTNFVRAIGHEKDIRPTYSHVVRSGTHRTIHVSPPGAPNYQARIDIDVDRRCIDWSRTSGELFGHVHHSSGEIGFILLSLPLVPFASPYLISQHLYYRQVEKREQMSRHCWAILKALQGQIDAETEKLLRDAFRREWREQRLSIAATNVEEAAEFLKGCDQLVDAKAVDAHGVVEAEYLDWVDNMGDTVACGYRRIKALREDAEYGEDNFDGNQVKVGQLDLTNEDAARLFGCYRTRRDLVKDIQKTSEL